MDNIYSNKTPGQLADLLLQLTATYSDLSDELSEILHLKDLNWSILRDTVTSDKQADRKWFLTKPGTREREIDFEMKKIQRQMSSIKAYLNVKENEARNLY